MTYDHVINEVEIICKGHDFRDFCIDRSLIERGKRREFSNVHVFVGMGFEFTDVINIDDWTLNQIPLGAPLFSSTYCPKSCNPKLKKEYAIRRGIMHLRSKKYLIS